MNSASYCQNCVYATHPTMLITYLRPAAKCDHCGFTAELALVKLDDKPKRLTCCCCGEPTRGRQWWNRDAGFGLCERCADWIPAHFGTPADEMHRSYGIRGVHYCVKEASRQCLD